MEDLRFVGTRHMKDGEVLGLVFTTGPGRLVFYCSVFGHRAAGMAGTIDVE